MIALRMRGMPPALWFSAVFASAPFAFVLYERLAMGARLDTTLVVSSVAVALLPWLSRLAGRISYRAAFDDLALHVGGEALVFGTVSRVTEQRTWRRRSLVFHRGRVLRVELVVYDLFAGKLEPLDELMKQLPEGIAQRP